MAAKNWFLLADDSRARLFEMARRDGSIDEIADFAHPEGRSQDGELASYDGGISSRPGPRTGPQQPSALDHYVEMFAKELARYLEHARTEHRYEHLYLVAAPGFLGRLRNNLTKDVENLLVETIDKDISWFSGPEVVRYLKEKVARPASVRG